jgi:hypothetical protein
VVALVVVAVLLGAGYIVLDRYSDGEKSVTITESRGAQIIQGLLKHKMETSAYPDALAKLVPKFIAALPKCPSGEPFAYVVAGTEFTLTCQKVGFTSKPYGYDSRSRVWRG